MDVRVESEWHFFLLWPYLKYRIVVMYLQMFEGSMANSSLADLPKRSPTALIISLQRSVTFTVVTCTARSIAMLYSLLMAISFVLSQSAGLDIPWSSLFP
jgi:hypothetical protein